MRIILENEQGQITELEGDPSHFMQGDIIDVQPDSDSPCRAHSYTIEYRRLMASFQDTLGYMYLIVKERKLNG